MNREILFRAKDVTGKWRYGYLITLPNMNPEHRPLHIFDDTTQDWYEIDPSTVGQYTGLIDNDCMKIFEGDIVRSYDGMFAVKYQDTQACFMLEEIGIEVLTYLSRYQMMSEFQIIGNVFDSPELLETAAQYANQDGLMPAT